MSIALQLAAGASRDYPFQALNADGSVPSFFVSTDPITCAVWTGESEAPVAEPSASWISAAQAQFMISFQDLDTANLSPLVYYIQATASHLGRSVTLLPRGSTIEIVAAPGSAPARPTYITYQDLAKIAPWISDLQAPSGDSGFADQCADARDWIDELILRNYRGGNVSLLGYHGFALDAWYTGGARRTSLTNRWLKECLVANMLLVTPRVKAVCAYFALSRICESMITSNAQYISLSARFRLEAESLVASTTFELDINGDGFGEVPINMSSTNTLWA
jgi:hypothetical protein